MTLCDLLVEPSRLLCAWNSLGKNTGVGGHLLLDGNLPNLGITPGSPALQWILYHLSPYREVHVLMENDDTLVTV